MAVGVISKLQFSGMGFYRISVQGHVDRDLCESLGSMRVPSRRSRSGPAVTVLEGQVVDQAELNGILNTLYELHYPLISVTRLDKETEQSVH